MSLATPYRLPILPDGTLDLTRAVFDPGAVAEFLLGAASCEGARFSVCGSAVHARISIPDAVAEARALVRPPLAVRVQTDDVAHITSITVSRVNFGLEVPFLISDGPLEGQRILDRGFVRITPTLQAEARLRHAGLADDELRALPELALDSLPNSALSRDVVAALVGSSRLDSAEMGRVLVSLGAFVDSRGRRFLSLAGAVSLLDGNFPGLPKIELRTFAMGRAANLGRGVSPVDVATLTGTFSSLKKLVPAIQKRSQRPAAAEPLVREAIVNAIVHRSYAKADLVRPIVVEQYDDALVVRSPGAPLARVGMATDEGPHENCSRNPRLLGMAARRRVAQGFGAGVALLRRRARAAGYRPAKFEVDGDTFVVTLTVDPEAYLDRIPGDRDVVREPKPTSTPVKRKGRSRMRLSASARDAQVLAAMAKASEPLSASELATRLGVSAPTVRTSLARLQEAGSVEPLVGRKKSPKRKFVLV